MIINFFPLCSVNVAVVVERNANTNVWWQCATPVSAHEVKTSSTLGKPGQGQCRWKSQYQLIAESSVNLNDGYFGGKA